MTFIVHAIEYWGWSIAMSRLGNGDDRPQFSRDVAGMMLLFSQLMAINLFAIGVNSFFIIALHGEGGQARLSLWNHPGDSLYGMFARLEQPIDFDMALDMRGELLLAGLRAM